MYAVARCSGRASATWQHLWPCWRFACVIILIKLAHNCGASSGTLSQQQLISGDSTSVCNAGPSASQVPIVSFLCGLRPTWPSLASLAREHSLRARGPAPDSRLSVVEMSAAEPLWDAGQGVGQGEEGLSDGWYPAAVGDVKMLWEAHHMVNASGTSSGTSGLGAASGGGAGSRRSLLQANAATEGEAGAVSAQGWHARVLGWAEFAALPLLRAHASGNSSLLLTLNASASAGEALPQQFLVPPPGQPGGPAAVPLLLLYRRDWWEALAGVAAPPPRTWDQLMRLASELVNRDLDGDGRSDHVLCLDLGRGCKGWALLSALFASLAQTRGTEQGLWFSGADLSPTLGGPAMSEALRLYGALAAYNPPVFTPGGANLSSSVVPVSDSELTAGGGGVDADSGTPQCGGVNPLFAAGRCLFTVDWATAALRLTRSASPQPNGMSGQLGAAILPGSAEVAVGTPFGTYNSTGGDADTQLQACTTANCPHAQEEEEPPVAFRLPSTDATGSATAPPSYSAVPSRQLVNHAPFLGEGDNVWSVGPEVSGDDYIRVDDFLRLVGYQQGLKYAALMRRSAELPPAAAGNSSSTHGSGNGTVPCNFTVNGGNCSSGGVPCGSCNASSAGNASTPLPVLGSPSVSLDINPNDEAAVLQAVAASVRHPNAAMDVLLPYSSSYRAILDDLAARALELRQQPPPALWPPPSPPARQSGAPSEPPSEPPSSDATSASAALLPFAAASSYLAAGTASPYTVALQAAMAEAVAGYRNISRAFPYPAILLLLYRHSIGAKTPPDGNGGNTPSGPGGNPSGPGTNQGGGGGSSLPVGTVVGIAVGSAAAAAGVLACVVVAVMRRWWRGRPQVSRAGGAKPPGAGPATTLVLTDVQSSTILWEALSAELMDACMSLHHGIMRAAIESHHGYEVFTEGDAFAVAFHAPDDAVAFAMELQMAMLAADWPAELLEHPEGCEVWARRNTHLAMPPASPAMTVGSGLPLAPMGSLGGLPAGGIASGAGGGGGGGGGEPLPLGLARLAFGSKRLRMLLAGNSSRGQVSLPSLAAASSSIASGDGGSSPTAALLALGPAQPPPRLPPHTFTNSWMSRSDTPPSRRRPDAASTAGNFAAFMSIDEDSDTVVPAAAAASAAFRHKTKPGGVATSFDGTQQSRNTGASSDLSAAAATAAGRGCMSGDVPWGELRRGVSASVALPLRRSKYGSGLERALPVTDEQEQEDGRGRGWLAQRRVPSSLLLRGRQSKPKARAGSGMTDALLAAVAGAHGGQVGDQPVSGGCMDGSTPTSLSDRATSSMSPLQLPLPFLGRVPPSSGSSGINSGGGRIPSTVAHHAAAVLGPGVSTSFTDDDGAVAAAATAACGSTGDVSRSAGARLVSGEAGSGGSLLPAVWRSLRTTLSIGRMRSLATTPPSPTPSPGSSIGPSPSPSSKFMSRPPEQGGLASDPARRSRLSPCASAVNVAIEVEGEEASAALNAAVAGRAPHPDTAAIQLGGGGSQVLVAAAVTGSAEGDAGPGARWTERLAGPAAAEGGRTRWGTAAGAAAPRNTLRGTQSSRGFTGEHLAGVEEEEDAEEGDHVLLPAGQGPGPGTGPSAGSGPMAGMAMDCEVEGTSGNVEISLHWPAPGRQASQHLSNPARPPSTSASPYGMQLPSPPPPAQRMSQSQPSVSMSLSRLQSQPPQQQMAPGYVWGGSGGISNTRTAAIVSAGGSGGGSGGDRGAAVELGVVTRSHSETSPRPSYFLSASQVLTGHLGQHPYHVQLQLQQFHAARMRQQQQQQQPVGMLKRTFSATGPLVMAPLRLPPPPFGGAEPDRPTARVPAPLLVSAPLQRPQHGRKVAVRTASRLSLSSSDDRLVSEMAAAAAAGGAPSGGARSGGSGATSLTTGLLARMSSLLHDPRQAPAGPGRRTSGDTVGAVGVPQQRLSPPGIPLPPLPPPPQPPARPLVGRSISYTSRLAPTAWFGRPSLQVPEPGQVCAETGPLLVGCAQPASPTAEEAESGGAIAVSGRPGVCAGEADSPVADTAGAATAAEGPTCTAGMESPTSTATASEAARALAWVSSPKACSTAASANPDGCDAAENGLTNVGGAPCGAASPVSREGGTDEDPSSNPLASLQAAVPVAVSSGCSLDCCRAAALRASALQSQQPLLAQPHAQQEPHQQAPPLQHDGRQRPQQPEQHQAAHPTPNTTAASITAGYSSGGGTNEDRAAEAVPGEEQATREPTVRKPYVPPCTPAPAPSTDLGASNSPSGSGTCDYRQASGYHADTPASPALQVPADFAALAPFLTTTSAFSSSDEGDRSTRPSLHKPPSPLQPSTVALPPSPPTAPAQPRQPPPQLPPPQQPSVAAGKPVMTDGASVHTGSLASRASMAAWVQGMAPTTNHRRSVAGVPVRKPYVGSRDRRRSAPAIEVDAEAEECMVDTPMAEGAGGGGGGRRGKAGRRGSALNVVSGGTTGAPGHRSSATTTITDMMSSRLLNRLTSASASASGGSMCAPDDGPGGQHVEWRNMVTWSEDVGDLTRGVVSPGEDDAEGHEHGHGHLTRGGPQGPTAAVAVAAAAAATAVGSTGAAAAPAGTAAVAAAAAAMLTPPSVPAGTREADLGLRPMSQRAFLRMRVNLGGMAPFQDVPGAGPTGPASARKAGGSSYGGGAGGGAGGGVGGGLSNVGTGTSTLTSGLASVAGNLSLRKSGDFSGERVQEDLRRGSITAAVSGGSGLLSRLGQAVLRAVPRGGGSHHQPPQHHHYHPPHHLQQAQNSWDGPRREQRAQTGPIAVAPGAKSSCSGGGKGGPSSGSQLHSDALMAWLRQDSDLGGGAGAAGGGGGGADGGSRGGSRVFDTMTSATAAVAAVAAVAAARSGSRPGRQTVSGSPAGVATARASKDTVTELVLLPMAPALAPPSAPAPSISASGLAAAMAPATSGPAAGARGWGGASGTTPSPAMSGTGTPHGLGALGALNGVLPYVGTVSGPLAPRLTDYLAATASGARRNHLVSIAPSRTDDNVFDQLWRDVNAATTAQLQQQAAAADASQNGLSLVRANSGVVSTSANILTATGTSNGTFGLGGGTTGTSWCRSAITTVAAALQLLYERMSRMDAIMSYILDHGSGVHRERGEAGGGAGGAEPELVLRGLRIRVGIHSGPRESEVELTVVDRVAVGRYLGDFLAACKEVCEAAAGGMVLLSGAAFRAHQQLRQRSRPLDVMMMHMGDHIVRSNCADFEGFTNRGSCARRRSIAAPNSPALPIRELYAALCPGLLPRLVVLPSLLSTYREVVPGCLSAPAGLVTPVFCNVVGVESLLAWEKVLMERQLRAAAALRASLGAGAGGESAAAAAMHRPQTAHLLQQHFLQQMQPQSQAPPPAWAAGRGSTGDGGDGGAGRGVGIVRAALDLLRGAVSDAASMHGGYVVAASSDGGHWVLVFGSPQQAVRWGLGMLDAMLTAAWPDGFLEHELTEEVWEGGVLLKRGLRLRIGIDCGQAMIRLVPRTGRLDYVGRPMNRAARIAAKAKAASVLVSDAVWSIARTSLGAHVATTNLGLVSLKGVKEPLELWALRARRREPG